jgi:4-hydroxybenzoate polyprenyltransferase
MVSDVAIKAPASFAAHIRALRPRQWVKNFVLFAGIIFTLDQHHHAGDWIHVVLAFVVFCALASAIYLVNDVCDVEQDRKHPRKQHRPIASGAVSVHSALTMAGFLGIAGMAGAVSLGGWFAPVAAGYVLLTLAYSFWLKHAAIIDVIALAMCYVARAVAGAAVIGVDISSWLFICTFLGALLIGLAKRRSELLSLENAGHHRRSLEGYTLPMLDQMIGIATSCTLMAYMLYTVVSQTGQERPLLKLTIPMVVYGIYRFYFMIHRHNSGGDPTAELTEDRPLLVCGLLWALTCVAAMLAR